MPACTHSKNGASASPPSIPVSLFAVRQRALFCLRDTAASIGILNAMPCYDRLPDSETLVLVGGPLPCSDLACTALMLLKATLYVGGDFGIEHCCWRCR